MRKGLCLLIWLMFLLITGCGDSNTNVNTDPDDGDSKDQNDVQKPVKTVGSIAVTGQIMLGPIMPGNNLKAEALDKENNSLGTSAVSSYGTYNIKLKDHNGPFIILVSSNNPNQCSGDYIDEAMGTSKCFGNRYLLSTSVVNTGEVNTSVNLEVHSSPATTMAAFHAGIDIKENGGLVIPNNLSKEIIAESNKAVAQVLGLGVKPITEIKPTSLITNDKKFKKGNAYASALAMISGVEAVKNDQSPNDLLRQISKGITTDNNSPQLNQAIQDMLVKGLHKVADKIKEKSTDTSILEAIIVDINNVQDNFPDSLYTVDLTKDLPKPQFSNSNKTSNLKPVWQWQSGDLGAGIFKYKFDNQTQWTVTTSKTFIPKSSLKLGIYKLEVREMAQTGEWGLAIESVIEIVANNKGTVSIDGEPKQGDNLTAKPNDLDGITSAINYSWFSDDQLITNINNSQYLLSESDVGKRIKVVIDYTDALGAQETAMAETAIILTNTESVVEITIPDPDDNSPPQAVPYTHTVETKVEALVELLATDSENNSLIFIIKSLPKNGILKDGGKEITLLPYTLKNNLTYTSTSEIGIEDSFMFVANDGVVDSSAAVIGININHPPLIINQPSLSIDFGDSYSFEPKVTDLNNDKGLTFNYENKPSWLEFDSANGGLVGTPQEGDLGLHENIYLTVTDSTGLKNRIGPYEIEVNDVIGFRTNAEIEQNVCWSYVENSSDFRNKSEVSEDVQEKIRDVAERSWGKHTALKFIGWDDCPEDMDNSYQGPTLRIVFFKNSQDRARYSKSFHALMLTIDISNHGIIHEFGHGLGFPHEHERWDTYSAETGDSYCRHINRYLPFANPEKDEIFDVRKNFNVLVVNRGKWQQQTYNPFSVMNYCMFGDEYFTDHTTNGDLLSTADINRAQLFYGAPSESGRHLMYRDEYFSGLFREKDKTEYTFYKYGAPATHINKLDLSNIKEQQYFAIYENQQNKSTLFKFIKDKQYLLPVNDPLAVCSPETQLEHNSGVIAMDCKDRWDNTKYSKNRFYYYDDPYGFFGEFSNLFCEEISDVSIDEDDKTTNFVRINDHDCIDFNQKIYQPYFYNNNNNRLFLKGKGYSGRLNGVPNISFKNGSVAYDEFEQNNSKTQRFNSKTKSFVDYSGYIANLPNNHSSYSGYFVKGEKVEDNNISLVTEEIKWNDLNISGLHQKVTYSKLPFWEINKLYKNAVPYSGKYEGKTYINGIDTSIRTVNDEKVEVINGYIYRINKSKYNLLGIQYNSTGFSKLTGFNPSTLGNGINSYYAQGYPTTILCKTNNSSNCSDKNDSVEEIYQKFKDINSDDIFAWINVVTQYSRYGGNLYYEKENIYFEDVAPILFKGNNPFTGDFDGINYRMGYSE